ncbi:methyl-accepting chemotaxis protein [Acidovorax lacteus]|uniref:Methyl-accepting chemotaxis protein n=1 Tax=Acidovorax lacteus TaxID=1924988 RepID=A0ABP8KYT5_9BURK
MRIRSEDIKIATRLTLLLVALCLLMVVIGAAGLLGMRDANQGLNTVYQDRVVPLKQLKVVADAYAVAIVDTAHKVRDGALSTQQGLESVRQARQSIQKEWTAYLATELVPAEVQQIERFKQLQVRADKAVDQLETVLKSQDPAALASFAARDMYPALDPLQEVLSTLSQLQLDIAKQEYLDSEATYRHARLLVVAAIVAAVVLSSLVGMATIRAITHPLRNAVELSGAIAQGDLTRRIDTRGSNEVAQLLQGLERMQGSLIQLAQAVRDGAENVATASQEIAQGNQDLSARTESQASALQETAASMEELNSTVRLNAEHSRQAHQLAQDACSVASQSGQVVTRVVSTMKDIHGQSGRIADIIGVIDGIAFQTNILALNAAVEAARAGEQGRGFAVVAGEVRSLAQRSAEAAREIKSLITASVERVEQGSELVDQAGQTMDRVVQAIERVSSIVAEISGASSEQSQGVDQVNLAVTQIDQVTQQNAALVEEMAAAAASLNQQARTLVGTTARFKLPHGAGPAQAALLPATG